jgi:hypothetical protein
MANEWSQPDAPPPPLFTGAKERDLVKQVNDELIERVVGQTIAYYPIDLERTYFHDLYGEAIQKTFLREGDFVLYGDSFYEIVTLSEPKLIYGQIDHKLEISAKCIRAREGLFDGT